ncbi:acyl-CoA carboxylase subunit epsilon [Actinomadura rupiterrae]|uniref:acyl-CoA carboxylase subunit epsilon n=1 Tax=Actinomadura rupiterrae TaxID=559627 RepID=UPI0020A520EF|nr:acyl-CoA carboxylase subunit epsilon [Actinomadura rupiterrae]
MTGAARADEPLLRVVRGAPSDEELAALTVAVLAVVRARNAGGAPDGAASPPAPGWVRPRSYRPPGAWGSPTTRAAPAPRM